MCGGSQFQSLVNFRFPFFPQSQFRCFSLEKWRATIICGLFQVTAISASFVEARLNAETSYSDEKILHVVHENCGVFKAHPTCVGCPLVVKCFGFFVMKEDFMTVSQLQIGERWINHASL